MFLHTYYVNNVHPLNSITSSLFCIGSTSADDSQKHNLNFFFHKSLIASPPFFLGWQIKSHVFQATYLPFAASIFCRKFLTAAPLFFHTTTEANWKKPVYVGMDCVTQLLYNNINSFYMNSHATFSVTDEAMFASMENFSCFHNWQLKFIMLCILFLLVIRNCLYGLVKVFFRVLISDNWVIVLYNWESLPNQWILHFVPIHHDSCLT